MLTLQVGRHNCRRTRDRVGVGDAVHPVPEKTAVEDEDDGIEEMVKIEAMEYGSDDEGGGVNQKSTSRGTMVENTASSAELVPKT